MHEVARGCTVDACFEPYSSTLWTCQHPPRLPPSCQHGLFPRLYHAVDTEPHVIIATNVFTLYLGLSCSPDSLTEAPRRPLHRHATLPIQDLDVMSPDGQSSTLSRMPGRGSLCLDKSRHKPASSKPAPTTPPVWFVVGGGPGRGDWCNQGSFGAAGALDRIEQTR